MSTRTAKQTLNTPSPLDAITQFIAAINCGDLATALNLYAPGAAFVTRSGAVITGNAALHQEFAGFMTLKPTLTSEKHQIVESGDVAFYCSRWTMRGTDPAGNPVQQGGRSTDILRRQSDGHWRIAVDNPWGTELVA
jgi:ketosteroid isomerase-like protein